MVEELRAWLSEKMEQRQKLDGLRTEWLPRLRVCSPSDKEEITKLVRKAINSRKLDAARDALIEEMSRGAGGPSGDAV